MERDILFKGKTVDTEQWIYGSLIKRMNRVLIGGYEITPPTREEPGGDTIWVEEEVYSETVGQFTGMVDKNKVKIFEGKVGLEIVGVGVGVAEIVMHEGSWKIFEPSNGYYLLSDALANPNIILNDTP